MSRRLGWVGVAGGLLLLLSTLPALTPPAFGRCANVMTFIEAADREVHLLKARALLAQARGFCPDSGLPDSRDARIWQEQGDEGQARRYLSRALMLSPTDPYVLADAVLLYTAWDEPGTARAYGDRAEALAPHLPAVLFALARLAEEEGDTSRALAHLANCANIDPWGHCAFLRAKLLYRRGDAGDHDEANRLFALANRINPLQYDDHAVRMARHGSLPTPLLLLGGAIVLLLLLFAVYRLLATRAARRLTAQKRIAAERSARKQDIPLKVELRLIKRPQVQTDGLVTADRFGLAIYLSRPAWVAAFARTPYGTVESLWGGRNQVEPRYSDSSQPLPGSLVVETVGRPYHCFAIASVQPFDYERDLAASLRHWDDSACRQPGGTMLPLAENRFVQCYLQIVW